MSDFFYTQAIPQGDTSFADINQSIQNRAARMDAALKQNAAVRAAEERANAQRLSAAQKRAQDNLKRLDGYDSSQLIPPLRPLFREYVNQKLEDTNYFAIDDPSAIEAALDDISAWFVKHSAHTQNETVVSMHDEMFDLASDPDKRKDYAESKSPISELNLELPQFIEAEQYHRGGFAAEYRLEANGAVTAIDVSNIDAGRMPIYDMAAWGNPETYNPAKFLGTKATKTLTEIGTGWVRDAATTLDKTYDPEEASRKATSLIKMNKTDQGIETRRRIVENYFSDEMLANSDLVSEYIMNERDNEGNFVGDQTKNYQEVLFRAEAEAIDELLSIAPFTREEKEEGTRQDQEDEAQILYGVFNSDPVSFKQISGDSETMYGEVEALRRLGATPFGEHYSLERMASSRSTLPVENPAYAAAIEVNENGEKILPEDIDPVIEIKPRDVIIVPTETGKYFVIIDKISVDGSKFQQLVLDSEQHQDILKKLDYQIVETYKGYTNLQELVDHAQKKFNAYRDAENAEGSPAPTPTGRPDTSRY